MSEYEFVSCRIGIKDFLPDQSYIIVYSGIYTANQRGDDIGMYLFHRVLLHCTLIVSLFSAEITERPIIVPIPVAIGCCLQISRVVSEKCRSSMRTLGCIRILRANAGFHLTIIDL